MLNQNGIKIIVTAVLIAGLSLTAAISHTIYEGDQAAQRQALKANIQEVRQKFTRFDYSTKLYREAIESSLKQKQEALSGLRELFSSRETVGWKEFKGFVSPIHEQHPEVAGLFWIPRIDRDVLDQFARIAGEESPPGFRMRIDKEDIPSGNTGVWPVYFAFPLEPNRSWLGLDAQTHPIFKVLFEAHEEQEQAWISIAFSAEGKSSPEDFFLSMNLTNERRKLGSKGRDTVLHESGFVAALINIPTLVDTAVEGLDAEPLKIYLYDKEGRRVAATGPLTEAEKQASQTVEELKSSLEGATYIDRGINVAGDVRRWHAFFEPIRPIGRSIPSEHTGGGTSWLVAIAGVFITILMAALAYRVTSEMLKRKAAEAEQRQLAQRDGLTGLLNRRVLENILEREWTRAFRTGRPLSVLLLDLDHFKSINDKHGHSTGDYILRHMGIILRNAARQSDAACRYGGEEFCLILPETDLRAAYTVAERIRDEVASQTISIAPNESEPAIRVTCSVGIATANTSDSSGEDMLHRADNALYSAKKRGRNRVVAAE